MKFLEIYYVLDKKIIMNKKSVRPVITKELPFGWGDGEPPTPEGEQQKEEFDQNHEKIVFEGFSENTNPIPISSSPQDVALMKRKRAFFRGSQTTKTST